MYLVRKYTNFKRLHLKESPKETAEKELDHLNNKIEKLLVKLELGETEETASDYDECVICLSARVTIEVLPCGHKVVCRKCFIKTIQTAIVQRSLPLKCIVCRAKILKINNPDFEGGGGCHPSSSSKSRPKATARCRTDTTMTSQPMKSTPVRVTKATGCYSNQSPSTVVATKLMQPLLIYPSRSSPVQQRAFFTPSMTTTTTNTRTRATTNMVDVCATPTLRTHHHHHHHRLTTMTMTTMEQTVAADTKRTTTTTTSRLQNLVGGLFLRGS